MAEKVLIGNVRGPQGSQGVTFTPSVDAQGYLSWTNDGGLPNPQTVQIVGADGAPAKINGVNALTLTGGNNISVRQDGDIAYIDADRTDAVVWTATLPASGFANGAYTYENTLIKAGDDYTYLFDEADGSNGIFGLTADAVTEDGKMVFRCDGAPGTDFNIKLMRIGKGVELETIEPRVVALETALPGKADAARAQEPHNWYFPSGAVINQRGVSGTVSDPGYFIDRFKLASGNVTLTESGLLLYGEIRQIVESAYPNIRLVTALCMDGALIEGEWDAETNTAAFSANGKTLVAVDFAPGSDPVKFRKSGGVWELNVAAPDKGAELAKCQRYYQRITSNEYSAFGSGATFTTSDSFAYCFVPFLQEMRTIPAISISNCADFALAFGGANAAITSYMIPYNTYSKTGANLSFGLAGGNGVSKPCFLINNYPGHNAYIDLDANL